MAREGARVGKRWAAEKRGRNSVHGGMMKGREGVRGTFYRRKDNSLERVARPKRSLVLRGSEDTVDIRNRELATLPNV